MIMKVLDPVPFGTKCVGGVSQYKLYYSKFINIIARGMLMMQMQ